MSKELKCYYFYLVKDTCSFIILFSIVALEVHTNITTVNV